MTATLLPDPAPRQRHYTIISVDDHLIEPADLFEGRMPAHLADRAPRVVTLDNGRETWVYEDRFYPQVGLNAVVGRPKAEWNMEPARFDEMRRGCYDIEARVADMDLDGVYATSVLPVADRRLRRHGVLGEQGPGARSRVRCGRGTTGTSTSGPAPHPDRVIPLQLAWLGDPEIAAADIRANAARGFKAVSFPENPVDLQLPSIHTDHWDPVLRACEETETVVCLHNGSSSWTAARSPGAPLALYTSLFPVNALVTAADWLWARIPTRFPEIKIAFSEGGISWVPMLIDRIDVRARSLRRRRRRLGRSRRLADRRAAPQLLVLRDRRRLDDRAARAHRHRPHLPRERLSARRLDVARHAGARARRRSTGCRPTRSAS